MVATAEVVRRGGGPSVGAWRLDRRIGSGATGEVWEARHRLTGGVAAVKLLRPSAASRAGVRRFFAREGRAIARLEHPHIVALFELGDDYLITAYVDGGDLQRRLSSPIDPRRALSIASQIASALEHAHSRGVIHRDVKPANVLLDRLDNAYLADFGIAHLLDEADPGHDRAGTPAFMAPEQRRGAASSPAADQYALGRTLLEMLVGGPLPIDPDEALALAPPWVPEPLRAAIARATAAAPEERFPSMAAFAAALGAVVLDGIAPPVRLRPPLRAREPYAWCAEPNAVATPAPDVERADYTLARIAPRLPAGAASRYLASAGLAGCGWSAYGRVDRLGPLATAEAVARARAVVVLAHGFLGNRRAWHAVAPALCRDLPDTIVLTPDVHGAGETRFVGDLPSEASARPRALLDALLGWLELLALRGLPTVLVGHSFAGHALLTVGDDELDARTVRVAVTPYINLRENLGKLRNVTRLLRGVRHSRLAWQAGWKGYLWWQRHIDALGDDLIEPGRLEYQRCPPLLVIRALESLFDSTIAAGRLDCCVVMFGQDDEFLDRRLVPTVAEQYRIPAPNVRWIASGGHYPFFDHQRSPEAVARNRDEMVRTIGAAIEHAAGGTLFDTGTAG